MVISEPVAAACLLILSGVLFLPGGLLFTGRAILKWPSAQSRNYLYWERGFVMAAILVAALGFALLEKRLEAAGDTILAPTGMLIFLIGTVLCLVVESFSLNLEKYAYAPTVVFIVLVFIGEAAFGGSILHTGLLPAWVGWTTVIWNLAWLVILPIARREDMYYPWLFYVAPELIGIMLLVGR